MKRIFNKYLKKRFDNWYNKSNPQSKYDVLVKSSDLQAVYIARLGAVQAIAKINNKITILIKQKCFCTLSKIVNDIKLDS